MSISNLLIDQEAQYKTIQAYTLACPTQNKVMDAGAVTDINFFGELTALKLDLESVPVVASGDFSPHYNIYFDTKPDLQDKCVIMNYVPTSGTFTYDAMVQIVDVDPNKITFRFKNLGTTAISNKLSVHCILL